MFNTWRFTEHFPQEAMGCESRTVRRAAPSIFLKSDAVKLAQVLLRASIDPRPRAVSGDVMLVAINTAKVGKSITANLSVRVNAKEETIANLNRRLPCLGST